VDVESDFDSPLSPAQEIAELKRLEQDLRSIIAEGVPDDAERRALFIV
jgi:hypothetical protein